jgi:hypothetical protein
MEVNRLKLEETGPHGSTPENGRLPKTGRPIIGLFPRRECIAQSECIDWDWFPHNQVHHYWSKPMPMIAQYSTSGDGYPMIPIYDQSQILICTWAWVFLAVGNPNTIHYVLVGLVGSSSVVDQEAVSSTAISCCWNYLSNIRSTWSTWFPRGMAQPPISQSAA